MKLDEVIKILIKNKVLRGDKLITVHPKVTCDVHLRCCYCNQIDCACQHNSIIRDLTGLAMTESVFIDDGDNHMTLEEIAERIKL